MSKIIRCAIYTRKSTEDGLEQEFNSLDAQREACEAYAKSQKAEGWRIIKTPYDDGGFSGGNMDRPGLKQLMTDIEEDRVDLVLVYKIDRLTRALADFARIVDMFDGKGVSFVSVTQQFNTATSMGRLTLNMLLSFAQFEREVTGERIRDKVAASKKKGMWMGGIVPIGYRNADKKLVIDEEKAPMIRDIFRMYLELGTVRSLKAWCDEQGYGTNPRKAPDTIQPFSRGHLYRILGGPIYRGMVAHQGKIYEGQHEAIIDNETFEKVEKQMAENRINRNTASVHPLGSLLTSKIKDETGDRLTPIYTVKAGKRYRYYVSSRTQVGPKNSIDGWSERHIIQHARGLIDSITIAPGEMTITMNRKAISKELEINLTEEIEPLATVQSFTHQKRGVEQRLIFGKLKQSQVDNALLARLKDAQTWMSKLADGRYTTLKEIAEETETDLGNVSRNLRLAFLAPDIKEAIIEGTQPPSLTLENLKKAGPMPACWKEQRELLGF